MAANYLLSVARDQVVNNCPEGGLYTTDVYSLELADETGNLYRHEHVFTDYDAAYRLYARVLRSWGDRAVDVSDNDHWYFFRRIYGSVAYQQNCREEEGYSQRLDVEGEFGPGSYHSGGPGFIGQ